MNRLVLIDGNAILHRAYHALPPLTAPDGTLVNAVYGFASMLLKLYENLSPTHMAVAFDRPGPTFRKKLFKAYQAKRPKMDDELAGQVEKVHELVGAFGIPVFEKDGFEADDVIGTIVGKVSKDTSAVSATSDTFATFATVIIVTGDRDLLQLVIDEKVLVYMPTKGLSEAKLYGEKEVAARMGVLPSLVPDLKALAGDSSDNYPGVSGIGPKTAVSLLLKYGSLEAIYRHLSAIAPAAAEKLKHDKESAILGKKLATITRNVPLDVSLPPLAGLDTAESRAFLTSLHFHSLVKRLAKGAPAAGEEKQEEKKDRPQQQQLL